MDCVPVLVRTSLLGRMNRLSQKGRSSLVPSCPTAASRASGGLVGAAGHETRTNRVEVVVGE